MTGQPPMDGAPRRPLRGCAGPLTAQYDTLLLDLDGVVYIGREAVPGAAEELARARESGVGLAFVTNNASRPPGTVADHLTALGVPAGPHEVVTSAQAAARLVAEEVPEGSAVFVIGGEGLRVALAEHGLRAVQRAEDEPVAVVSGFSPDLRWGTVVEGAILVRRGLPWVASNTDGTVPTPLGPGPGNGVLVRAVATFAGREPVVAGKPEPPLFAETVRRVGSSCPLVVGDRLDTDIEGAVRSGHDSLLVLTGVTGLPELLAADAGHRPTYVGTTLAALHRDHPEPRRRDDLGSGPGADHEGAGVWTADGWACRVHDGELVVSGDGHPEAWWPAVAAAAWAHRDATGSVPGHDGLSPPG